MNPKFLAIAFCSAITFFTQTTYGQVCLPSIAHDSLQLVISHYSSLYDNVSVAEQKGDTLFLAGSFSYVGPYTGGMAPVDMNGNIARPANWPRVHGAVYAMVPDGSGGFYIGGNFLKVGDSVRRNFVQIDKYGQITPFRIDVSIDTPFTWEHESIKTMVKINGKLFITGRFSFVNNRIRENFACIDLASGGLTPWYPQILKGATVNRMQEYEGTLYMSGIFKYPQPFGGTRGAVLYMDSASNHSLGWLLYTGSTGEEILDFSIDDSTIYVCGNFNGFAGSSIKNIAAWDLRANAIKPWAPMVDGIVRSICVVKNKVYMAGNFTTLFWSISRDGLAAVDKNNSYLVSSWAPNIINNASEIYRIRPYKDKIYTAGSYRYLSIPSQPAKRLHGLAAIDTFGTITSWAPQAGFLNNSEGPTDFYFNNDTVYVMGDINSIGGKPINSLVGINTKSNTILPLAPLGIFAVKPISALKRSNNKLYFGLNYDGGFTTKNGYRNNIAEYDIVGDSITSWNPGKLVYNPSGAMVYAIETLKSNVYVGGHFNMPRKNIVQLDTTTGSTTTWNANLGPSNFVFDIKSKNNRVFVSGTFQNVNQIPRIGLAVFDESGNLMPWTADTVITKYGYVSSIDFLGDKMYLGTFDSGIVKVDTTATITNPTIHAWNPMTYRTGLRRLKERNGKIYAHGNNFLATNIDTGVSGSARIMQLGAKTITGYELMDSSVYLYGNFSYVNGGQKSLTGLVRYNVYSDVDTGHAKIMPPKTICTSANQKQLWHVSTNIQMPTFTWYINGDTVIKESHVPSTRLLVQNGDTVYCMVTANSGCYLSQSVYTDTIIVKSNVINTASAKLIGPDTVCKNVAARYKLDFPYGVSKYSWTYPGVAINNDTNEYTFIPPNTGMLICNFTVADTGCFTSETGADTIHIKHIATQINPYQTFSPATTSNNCVGDSITVKVKSNVYWGNRQWTINGLNVAANIDSIIVPSLQIGDNIKSTIIADMPNCFTKQIKVDSIVTNPQSIQKPTITISGPANIGLLSTVNITANLINSGTNYNIFWNKNGSYFDTTTVLNTTYVKQFGNDNIYAILVSEGCYEKDTSTTIVVAEAISINQLSNDKNISVYPVPSKGIITIKGIEKGDIVSIVDPASSRILYKWPVLVSKSDYQYDIEELPIGVYLLKVINSSNQLKSILKIQKQ